MDCRVNAANKERKERKATKVIGVIKANAANPASVGNKDRQARKVTVVRMAGMGKIRRCPDRKANAANVDCRAAQAATEQMDTTA